MRICLAAALRSEWEMVGLSSFFFLGLAAAALKGRCWVVVMGNIDEVGALMMCLWVEELVVVSARRA